MNKRSKEIKIYTGKFLRVQIADFIKFIVLGAIIALLVVFAVKDSMFAESNIIGKGKFILFEGTQSGFFAIVSACIWVGIFNSIQLICREKNTIVKDELDKGLHASSYMAAHFISQAILCLIQSIIITLICWFMILRDGTVVGGELPKYLVSIFLMIYSADALALIISAVTPNPVTAMTVMPFVLILQLLMCGVLFRFEDGSMADYIGYLTISKWGMRLLGSIGGLNGSNMLMQTEMLRIQMPSGFEKMDHPEFSDDGIYIIGLWVVLIAFIAVSFVISTLCLKLTTRKVSR